MPGTKSRDYEPQLIEEDSNQTNQSGDTTKPNKPRRRDGELKIAFLNHILGEIQDCELTQNDTAQAELPSMMTNTFVDYMELVKKDVEKADDKKSAHKSNEPCCVFECPAKLFKLIQKSWKDFGSGELQLHSNKQLVIRNKSTGRLQLKTTVAKGMVFEKLKKKKIMFKAMEVGEQEGTLALLHVNLDKIDSLVKELKNMSGSE